MIEIALKCAVSYLLGSLVGSLIVGRFHGGVDIRALGSGNAGGTNALRTQGVMFAFWVMLIDVGKGFVAVRIVAPLALLAVAPAPPEWREWLPVLCGLASIVGHVSPLWYGFRGGKGVATVAGVLLGLDVWLLVPVLITWLVVLALSGYVSLASMSAAIALPTYIVASGYEPRIPPLVFGAITAALVLFTHRSNIFRMRAGVEPRARRLWLLGRRRG